MYTIEMRHKVDDYALWKQAFDAAKPIRVAAGEVSARVYKIHGADDDIMVSMDWDSLEKATAFLGSARLIEGMAKAGVREMPHMLILVKQDE